MDKARMDSFYCYVSALVILQFLFGFSNVHSLTISRTLNEDSSASEKIANINKHSSENLFEGDIMPSSLQNAAALDEGSTNQKRDSIRNQAYLWRTRIVPYEFSSEYSPGEVTIIKDAMKIIEEKSCLKFNQHADESNWILFKKLDGCFSPVGKLYYRPGAQVISLGIGCIYVQAAIHEIMHSLGFWHEQSRPDRDSYVEIFWENIKEGEEYNFEKYSHLEADVLGVDYDYATMMHYGKTFHSKNGLPTIQAIGNKYLPLGNAESLTAYDIIQLNAMYDCKNSGKDIWSSWSGYAPCDSRCFKKRQRFCSHADLAKCPSADAFGVAKESIRCTEAECYAPVDGHWSRWSMWSKCAPECGERQQTRKRSCVAPKPKYGGNPCAGDGIEAIKCTTRACSTSCTFEDDDPWCSWKNDLENSYRFPWQRTKDNTPTVNTGPDRDHTTGEGHYVYAETSNPSLPGDKARMVSKEMGPTEGQCLSFWYSMNGKEMGTLKVFIRTKNGAEREIWKESGDKGSRWIQSRKTIVSQTPYQVIFEAEKGSGYYSDIAIDDIAFQETRCVEASQRKIMLCGVAVEKLGCFTDMSADRALPELLDSHREAETDHQYVVDWYNYKSSLKVLACHCAERAKGKGYTFFGLQYYAECWSGPGPLNYTKYGPSTQCIDGEFRDCSSTPDTPCSGRESVNSVYRLI